MSARDVSGIEMWAVLAEQAPALRFTRPGRVGELPRRANFAPEHVHPLSDGTFRAVIDLIDEANATVHRTGPWDARTLEPDDLNRQWHAIVAPLN